MTIRLKHAQGKLEAIELFQLQHHLAISRLKHYLQVKGSKHCKLIKRISVSHSSLNEKDFIALHDILKLSSKVNEISFMPIILKRIKLLIYLILCPIKTLIESVS